LDFSNGLDFYLGFFFTPGSSLPGITTRNPTILTTRNPTILTTRNQAVFINCNPGAQTIQPISYLLFPALLMQNFPDTSTKKMSNLAIHCQ